MFTVQTALGKYDFTVNGVRAWTVVPLQASRLSCADLLPELWEIIFNELDHQAELIISAGVCREWRRLALRVLGQWIDREHARAPWYQYRRDEDFSYRGRALQWRSCLELTGDFYHVHIWREGIYLDDDEDLCDVSIQLPVTTSQ